MTSSASNDKLLFDAAKVGNLEEVKELLSKGTGTEYKDAFGNTTLIAASEKGHHEVVRTLLECGAAVNAKDKLGWTALMGASWNGQLDTVRTLLEYGAEVGAQTNTGNTALIRASTNGKLEVVRTLLEYGAFVGVQDKNCRDALYWACRRKNWDVAEHLLLNGANADVTDEASSSSFTSNAKINPPMLQKRRLPTHASDSAVPVAAVRTESEEKIASLTSQLNEAQDRLLSLNQLLENQLQGSEAMIKSLRFQLSEVEKRNKLLTGDHDALRNITLEQCDELILTSHHNQEKLLQRRATLINERHLCVICQDAQKTILLRPCNHLCLCGNCASNVTAVTRCPLCNTTITERITVFA